ncbi:hypothetical protein ARMSODRAFT_1004971 [Armillaria solidipes]|uniref:Uncharacterized protein n=1 Tax=Armillaria solidipes TaxID=1076256 RepID=A0A2H3BZ50_9AGAR|nr:hypothetical protein ARMSODRAFT_1004971 [Armillaria solidipes]
MSVVIITTEKIHIRHRSRALPTVIVEGGIYHEDIERYYIIPYKLATTASSLNAGLLSIGYVKAGVLNSEYVFKSYRLDATRYQGSRAQCGRSNSPVYRPSSTRGRKLFPRFAGYNSLCTSFPGPSPHGHLNLARETQNDSLGGMGMEVWNLVSCRRREEWKRRSRDYVSSSWREEGWQSPLRIAVIQYVTSSPPGCTTLCGEMMTVKKDDSQEPFDTNPYALKENLFIDDCKV